MSHATMSLPAIYDYAKDVQNIDIFSGLNVPSAITRQDLIDRILIRSMPFECVYPNAQYLQAAIANWSNVHARTFQKWCDALAIAYDPLNNYDRTETLTESGLESRIRKHDERVNDTTSASDDTETLRKGGQNSTTIGSTKDNTNVDNTTTDSVSAYDSGSWSNANKSVTGTGTANTGANMQGIIGHDSDETSTQTDHVGNRTADTKGGENENAINSRSHSMRAFGNIGVTTSQQMLQAELDIDAWNVYEHITDLFIDEFCVLLY